MKIRKLIWSRDRVDRLDRDGVLSDEVDETCFGNPFVQKAKSEGENRVYYVLGQTRSGRYLLCVVIGVSDGLGYPVTARPMSDRERMWYDRWRNP